MARRKVKVVDGVICIYERPTTEDTLIIVTKEQEDN